MTVTLAMTLALLDAADSYHHKIDLDAQSKAGREPDVDRISANAAWRERHSRAYEAAMGPAALFAVRAFEVDAVDAYAAMIVPDLTATQRAKAEPLIAAARKAPGFERSRILTAARKAAGLPGLIAAAKPAGPLPFSADEIAALTPAEEMAAPPVSPRIQRLAGAYVANTERIRAKHHGGGLFGSMGDHAEDAYERQIASYDDDDR